MEQPPTLLDNGRCSTRIHRVFKMKVLAFDSMTQSGTSTAATDEDAHERTQAHTPTNQLRVTDDPGHSNKVTQGSSFQ